MRKTVSITISGQLFHIEEQAYRKLDEYLESIRYHFSTYEDREEIVSDIEGRVAEHFTEKLAKARNVVSEVDVDDLIARMGTVKDFEAFEGDAAAHEAAATAGGERMYDVPKRLYRDVENQMIAGVAAGIANYVGIDPTVVRLLFLISLFFGGAGAIVYIVLWIVMPEAKTASEKMEMRGHPLTLKRIEETVRQNIPAAKEHIKPGAFTRAVRFPFMLLRQLLAFIGKVIRAVVPVLGRIVGFLIAAGAGVALFMLVFAAIMLASGSWDGYMDVPVRELAGNFIYYMLLVSGFFVALVPGILVLLVGVSLLLLRNTFRFPVVIALLALWVLSLMLGAVVAGTEGPVLFRNIRQYEESFNASASRSIETGAFRSISAHGHYDVRVRSGTGMSVTVTGPQRAVEELSAEVRDGVLSISRAHRNRFCIICLGNNAVVRVTLADNSLENIEALAGASVDLDGIDLTGERVVSKGGARVTVHNGGMPQALTAEAMGGSRIDIEGLNRIESLTADAAAGSRIAYAGDADNVSVDTKAGSRVTLRGSGSVLEARVIAGSRLEALEFAVSDAQIEAAAEGRAEVNASGRITGSVNGGGEIRYVGQPQVDVDEHVSGSVRMMEEYD